MFESYLKNLRVFKNLEMLLKFLRKMRFKPLYLVIPLVFSFFTALFDGLSKAILIPVIKGLINLDFSFAYETPFLRDMLSALSKVMILSNVAIFMFLVSLVFIVGVTQYAMAYFASTTLLFQARKFTNSLRKLIFERYLSFGKLFFDRTSFGNLNAVLVSEVDYVSQNMVGIQHALTEIFRLGVYLILLSLISWKLTLLVCSVLPVLYYGLSKIIATIRETSRHLAESITRLNRKIFNVLSNITLVKFYSKEREENIYFSKISDTRTHLEFSIDKKRNIITPIQSIFMLAIFLLLTGAAFFLVKIEKGSDISKFLVYIYVLRNSMVSFGAVNSLRAVLGGLHGHIGTILKIFDDKDKYFVSEGRYEFQGLKEAIKFRHLNFSYISEKRVLNDVSFMINKGEMVALVGPTGAGKTTIVNLLMRFYDCSPETIVLDGTDIRDFTLKSLRDRMAFVSQDTLLFDDTLKNNVLYGLSEISEERFFDSLKKARLYDFVKGVPNGVDTFIGDRGIQLSGGERQRLSITRALLRNSEILILDEATSSLDSTTEKKIQEAIEEAIKGRTTIVIAHRFSTIKNCDRIIVIDEGRVVESGTLNELLKKKEKFYEYWEEQKFY